MPPARPRPYRFSFTFRQGNRAGYEVHIHTIQLNIEKLIGGTVGMDSCEFGAYMSLIVACYQAKNNLPNDEIKLSRIARCSLKTWRRISPQILSKFTVTDISISSESVQKEIEKYNRLSTKNKSNRLKLKETDRPVVEPKSDFGGTNTNNNNQITNNNIKDIAPFIPLEGESVKKSPKARREKKPVTFLSEDWKLPDEWGDWAVSKGMSEDRVIKTWPKFRDNWLSKGEARADWQATWRTWVTNALEKGWN